MTFILADLDALVATATSADELDVGADLAEDLGLPRLATDLRWQAVIMRCRYYFGSYSGFHGARRVGRVNIRDDAWGRPLVFEGRRRSWTVMCPVGADTVQWYTNQSANAPDWEWSPCDPPACAPAVLEALRAKLF